jgi:dTDP-glucose 4,6-dehydratase
MVTGGLGFIGSYVAQAVFEAFPEDQVLVVDRCNYAASIRNVRRISHSPRFALECFDLSDEAAVRACVMRYRPRLILHLAAETHVDRSFGNALDFTRGNVLGTHALLEAARVCWGAGSGSAGVGRFVYMSTDEVYGSGADASEEGHAPQTSILAPTNPYAASKAAAEMQCLAYHRSFGMDVCVIRCNNVYGPRQFCEKVVPRFILQSLARRPFTVHGDGSQRRSFLYVKDAAAAVLAVAEGARPGEIVNVGHPDEVTILELASAISGMVAEWASGGREPAVSEASPSAEGAMDSGTSPSAEGAMDSGTSPSAEGAMDSGTRSGEAQVGEAASKPARSFPAVFGKDRLFNDYRYPVNVSRITELGWAPRVSFDKGMRTTIAWYLELASEWFCPEDVHTAIYSDGHFGGESAGSLSGAGARLTSSGGGARVPSGGGARVPSGGGARVPSGGGARVPSGGAASGSPQRVLLYGATGWIGAKIEALLVARGVSVIRGRARLDHTPSLWDELRSSSPTNVICAAGITGRPNIDWCETHVDETVETNLEGTVTLALLCARLGIHFTNFATGCIYSGDASQAFGEDDAPNFAGSLYSRTKAHAEKLQRGAAAGTTLLLRLRMPIDADFANPRNLLNKLSRYPRLVDLPNSVSVLPEVLPIAVHQALAYETGVYNLTNPGWTTPADIREKFDTFRAQHNVNENLSALSAFERVSCVDVLLSSGAVACARSNCVLSAEKLSSYAAAHGLVLSSATDAIDTLLRRSVA